VHECQRLDPRKRGANALEIVRIHSMQGIELALIVRLRDAYCMDQSEAFQECAHETRQHVELAARHLIIRGDEYVGGEHPGFKFVLLIPH
jgi:hypothetical protein